MVDIRRTTRTSASSGRGSSMMLMVIIADVWPSNSVNTPLAGNTMTSLLLADWYIIVYWTMDTPENNNSGVNNEENILLNYIPLA